MDIIQAARDAFAGATLGEQQRRIIDLLTKEIDAQRLVIGRLERELAAQSSLPLCPYCGAKGWRLIKTRNHDDYDAHGLQFLTFRCDVCAKEHESMSKGQGG